MRSVAALIALALFIGTAHADEPATPEELIGRWKVQRALHLGEEQSTDEVHIEIEFTRTQAHFRMWTPSEERPEQPTYIAECYGRPSDGFPKLDLKSSKDNRGSEKDIESLAIYKLNGNELKICSVSSDNPKDKKTRPTDFVSTPESKSDLNVLLRVGAN